MPVLVTLTWSPATSYLALQPRRDLAAVVGARLAGQELQAAVGRAAERRALPHADQPVAWIACGGRRDGGLLGGSRCCCGGSRSGRSGVAVLLRLVQNRSARGSPSARQRTLGRVLRPVRVTTGSARLGFWGRRWFGRSRRGLGDLIVARDRHRLGGGRVGSTGTASSTVAAWAAAANSPEGRKAAMRLIETGSPILAAFSYQDSASA